MSPSSPLASKIEGFSKTKVAVPLAPSLLRVSLTSGMVGSSMPRMNSMRLAAHVIWGRASVYLRVGRVIPMLETGRPVEFEEENKSAPCDQLER